MIVTLNKDDRAQDLFLKGFLISTALLIIQEIIFDRLGIHQGSYVPRSFGLEPLPFWACVSEWTLEAICLFGVYKLKNKRLFLGMLTIVFALGTAQAYANHKFLFLLMMIYLLSDPLAFKKESSKVFCYIKIQFIVVYVVSVIQKLLMGFYSGESLYNLLVAIESRGDGLFSMIPFLTMENIKLWCQVDSIFILVLELALPILLFYRFKVGFIVMILFHFSMTLFMPEIFAFSALMISCGLLFKID